VTLEGTVGGGDDQGALEPTVDNSVVDDTTASLDAAGNPEAAGQPAKAAQPTKDAQDELISDAEFERLQQEHNGDLNAIRQGMNRAFTQKTQKLAEARKQAEMAVQIVQQLQANPVEFIERVAAKVGVRLDKSTAPAVAKETKDEIHAELVEALGEEAANRLMPAFNNLIGKALKREIEPIKQHVLQSRAKEAEQLSEAALKSFGEKHPGWEQYEEKMFELAQKLEPRGMDEHEYLDTLYAVATRDVREANGVAKVISKINKAAAAAEPQARTVSPGKVANSPGRTLSFREAADLALKGQRVED
jgi:hypothetical protein